MANTANFFENRWSSHGPAFSVSNFIGVTSSGTNSPSIPLIRRICLNLFAFAKCWQFQVTRKSQRWYDARAKCKASPKRPRVQENLPAEVHPKQQRLKRFDLKRSLNQTNAASNRDAQSSTAQSNLVVEAWDCRLDVVDCHMTPSGRTTYSSIYRLQTVAGLPKLAS